MRHEADWGRLEIAGMAKRRYEADWWRLDTVGMAQRRYEAARYIHGASYSSPSSICVSI